MVKRDRPAADPKGNGLSLHRQEAGLGLAREERFSAFKTPKTVAAGQWDGDGPLEVFVLSEEEKAVGVSRYDGDTDRLGFPEPLPIATPGASPVSMAFVELNAGPAVAVVVQNRRDHALELHRPGGGAPAVIALEGVNRPPQSMLAADIDGDGSKDLLLFTPSEPMVMVRGLDAEAGPTVLTDRAMPQFGLVQAAGPGNTALLDVNGDGRDELLIADQNFVRACSFDGATGWRVVEQVTDPDARTRFIGLTVIDRDGAPVVVVSDKNAGRLVTMQRSDGAWAIADRMRLTGFDPRALFAGAFAGDGQPNILCLSDDAFGVVRLGGSRAALEEFAAWRSDEKNRLEHEISAGDLNSDGFVDLVVLDAGEQTCQILTLTASRRILEATEFKVFESRRFSGGEEREFEPSSAIIADVTGDGAPDLTLLCHDRLIVYPQMTAPSR
ncbi:MAG: VCBS repeat-containing protein [Phycisphaerales bacterium]|nr:VCBS repeat-containing protein [Phycisphaerales bacterium]